ncbi:hypothetical protein RSOLAG1IB_01219 [Rhizoctonia solani AG-1 IB]|uniref:Uncharacterized protein n=1 Tax=Thanatephorus cucumeris (strain AG1-IB / isolate 7/3/14) TaxID=1108050 RepID=A0A0B7FAY0_THACB|nr:hypothetical protein RSOLAG1IB_01219 [Rhizoctonia solani AG-1 IB]
MLDHWKVSTATPERRHEFGVKPPQCTIITLPRNKLTTASPIEDTRFTIRSTLEIEWPQIKKLYCLLD